MAQPFVVSLKLRFQETMQLSSVLEPARAIKGFELIDDPTGRSTVRANVSEEALEEVKRQLSKWCHVHPEVRFLPLGS